MSDWYRVKMKDYVECIRLITVYHYVLFEADTGSAIRGPYEKQALSSHYVPNEIIDKENKTATICIPPKVGLFLVSHVVAVRGYF